MWGMEDMPLMPLMYGSVRFFGTCVEVGVSVRTSVRLGPSGHDRVRRGVPWCPGWPCLRAGRGGWAWRAGRGGLGAVLRVVLVGVGGRGVLAS